MGEQLAIVVARGHPLVAVKYSNEGIIELPKRKEHWEENHIRIVMSKRC